ncbi:MAG: aromatic amino acid ammonia-lyase [Alphaproteobacteria bacterium]
MITINGEDLTIDSIAAVSRGEKVRITGDATVLGRVEASRQRIQDALASGQQIYGVTTLYGGMADKLVPIDQIKQLQKLSLWHHKTSTGPRLPEPDVRAAMLLRANSFLKGASAIRLEIIERYVALLNAGAAPHAYQRGSIGASGDLAPLAYIGAAAIGLDPYFKIDLGGETLDSLAALAKLGLKPIELEPKEGLAISNGTTACTGVAANCIARAYDLLALALGAHALMAQALLATSQSFDAAIHALKPHPGQVWIAAQMRDLLKGSKLARDEAAGDRSHRIGTLIQDRYSLRCLPQYMGPIADGIALAGRQVETEANSANDNPLINADTGEVYHTGNFLAQYTGVAMDNLRYQLAMLIKHLDVQIALLVAPEFNYGLPASLVGNPGAINMGLKSLQIGCNSIAPLVHFYGRSITDLYPTHAEQFNQNINSQAMNAANLARESVDASEHFIANALVFAVQAVELRAHLVAQSYDASGVLSGMTKALYVAARTAALGPPRVDKPLVWNDHDDGFIQPKVEGVLAAVRDGALVKSIKKTRDAIAALS